MKVTNSELEFISVWAREEWEPACYQLPAHRLQLAHQVTGAALIVFIKTWTETEQKKGQEILEVATTGKPTWPWATAEEFQNRLAEVTRFRGRSQILA